MDNHNTGDGYLNLFLLTVSLVLGMFGGMSFDEISKGIYYTLGSISLFILIVKNGSEFWDKIKKK